MQTENATPQSLNTLAEQVYAKLIEAADSYVSGQSKDTRREFYWEWDQNLGGDKQRRIDLISNTLKAEVESIHELGKRNGDIEISQILKHFLHNNTNKQEQEKISALIDLHEEFPHLEINFTTSEADELFSYIERDNPTFAEFLVKYSNILSEALRTATADISLQDELTFFHIADQSEINRISNWFTEKGLAGGFTRYIPEHLQDNLMEGVTREVIERLENYKITWQDLMDSRYLISVTGEFLADIGWGWQDLGRLVYPHDVDKAADFILDLPLLQDVEEMASAIKARREKVDPDDVVIIDKFVEEVPYLGRKNHALENILSLRIRKKLTTDREKRESLGGKSPREIVDMVANDFSLITRRWKYIGVEELLDNSSYVPSFALAEILRKAGMSAEDLQKMVFTVKGYRKWIDGIALTEQDLNGIRKLLSDNDNLSKILDYVDSEQRRDNTSIDISQALSDLPLTLQKEGFGLEFAQNIGNSYKKLLINIRNVREESEYRLVASVILNRFSSRNKGGAAKLIRELRAIDEAMHMKRDSFIATYHPELQGKALEISATKQKQEDRQAEKIRKQAERKRKEERELAVRNRQREQAQAQEKRKAEQHKENQQRQLLQFAKEVQEGRIKELANELASGRKLSADTPIFLQLRALVELIHLKTNISEADLIHLKETIADVTPTAEELDAIESVFLDYAGKTAAQG